MSSFADLLTSGHRLLRIIRIQLICSETVEHIGLCSVLRPHQHSIGYTGDGFYRSKDPTNSIKVLKEKPNLTKNFPMMYSVENMCAL